MPGSASGVPRTSDDVEVPDVLLPGVAEARVVVEELLALARDRLEMDIAWVAEVGNGRKLLRIVEGDCDGWGWSAGTAIPAAETYCARVLAGELDSLVADTAREPVVADLAITHEQSLRAYVGVPLVLTGGRVYGTFCAAGRAPRPQLDERDVRFMEVLAGVAARELERVALERRTRWLRARVTAVDALMAAIDARDRYTGEHCKSVVTLAGSVARTLGLAEDEVLEVEQLALVHDVGKLALPDAILRKPGPLTDEEWDVMRTHPDAGARIVGRIADLAHLAEAVRCEHERWDGRGYPRGLRDGDIPVSSRIVLVCDAFHAMVSDRPYRPALNHPAAVAELRANCGSQFWPDAVDALLQVLGTPPGRVPDAV